MRLFYSEWSKSSRAFAWLDQEQKPSKLYEELMAEIDGSYDHGLYPDRYHKKEILEYMDKIEADGEDRCNVFASLGRTPHRRVYNTSQRPLLWFYRLETISIVQNIQRPKR